MCGGWPPQAPSKMLRLTLWKLTLLILFVTIPFLLLNLFELMKWGCLKRNRGQSVEIWLSYELFCQDRIFKKNWVSFNQMAIKSSSLNFWLSPFAWDLQLCIVWRRFHQKLRKHHYKQIKEGGWNPPLPPHNTGGINTPCLKGLRVLFAFWKLLNKYT